ncbi:hypothetical protein [Rhizomonospora bruguierae]|uniref:hypothetical protein n=1 Tax=Rhizomonospora bruguierae TaxID=1581705 RepID=UPI001BD11305|nr:hypothetical protein [Micromonospora sp. NBRC 107566]
MTRWEYALLVRRRRLRPSTGGLEITYAWYGPDGSITELDPRVKTALAYLNEVGKLGWELASVSEERMVHEAMEIHRYHLKRPLPRSSIPRQLPRNPAPRSRRSAS